MIREAFALSIVPGVIFFSTYLLMTGTWLTQYPGRVSHTSLGLGEKTYIICNVVIYVLFVGMVAGTLTSWGTVRGASLLAVTLLLDGSLSLLAGYDACRVRMRLLTLPFCIAR
jgi:hypothetical protein